VETDPKEIIAQYLEGRARPLLGKEGHQFENGWALNVMATAILRLADEDGSDLRYMAEHFVKEGTFSPNDVVEKHLGRLTRTELARLFLRDVVSELRTREGEDWESRG
jgi:hypothetical protein